MPSKTHTNFSLGNPNLEPYRKVNSGKCYFRLAELTQYKTILPSNAYMRRSLRLPFTRELLCSRALQATPSFLSALLGCWQSAPVILLPLKGRHVLRFSVPWSSGTMTQHWRGLRRGASFSFHPPTGSSRCQGRLQCLDQPPTVPEKGE